MSRVSARCAGQRGVLPGLRSEALAGLCPLRRSERASAHRFCTRCGQPLATAAQGWPRAQPGGERRQLTVMFGDLVGSTALSHRLDPEELSDRRR